MPDDIPRSQEIITRGRRESSFLRTRVSHHRWAVTIIPSLWSRTTPSVPAYGCTALVIAFHTVSCRSVGRSATRALIEAATDR